MKAEREIEINLEDKKIYCGKEQKAIVNQKPKVLNFKQRFVKGK